MTNPNTTPPTVSVPASMKLTRNHKDGEVMIRAADVLRTLEDLAVVYDAHGYPTVGASVRSFRSSISHEIHKAITAEETP